ncbi:MAG: hypothetical protein R3C28_09405 [Pirellulaceae bacterium]
MIWPKAFSTYELVYAFQQSHETDILAADDGSDDLMILMETVNCMEMIMARAWS